MNKETQRKIIEINHALSGVHGPEIKQKATRISDVRYHPYYKQQRNTQKARTQEEALSHPPRRALPVP
jgi:hypothetical protein